MSETNPPGAGLVATAGGAELDPHALPPEVRLGNDVARHFAHLPHERAVVEMTTHLQKFWEPRMRHAIIAYVASGHPGLDPLLASGVAALEEVAGEDHVDHEELEEPSGG